MEGGKCFGPRGVCGGNLGDGWGKGGVLEERVPRAGGVTLSVAACGGGNRVLRPRHSLRRTRNWRVGVTLSLWAPGATALGPDGSSAGNRVDSSRQEVTCSRHDAGDYAVNALFCERNSRYTEYPMVDSLLNPEIILAFSITQ